MATEHSDGGSDGGSAARGEGGRWVTARIDRRRYHTEIEARGHTRTLDEPEDVGGTDTGPTPYEAMLGALGACTAMTVRMYADRKGWPLDGVQVRLRTAPSHEPDSARSARASVGPHEVERQLELVGPLTPEQRERLEQIADRCPVKQTLERGVRVRAASVDPSADPSADPSDDIPSATKTSDVR